MDDVQVKFAQLILAEILGAAMLLGGLYVSMRNLNGTSHLLFEGPGIGIRLTNATPGVVIALVGLALVYMSLDTKVVREVTTIDSPTQTIPGEKRTGPIARC